MPFSESKKEKSKKLDNSKFKDLYFRFQRIYYLAWTKFLLAGDRINSGIRFPAFLLPEKLSAREFVCAGNINRAAEAAERAGRNRNGENIPADFCMNCSAESRINV